MLLAIDSGNTNIVFAVFGDDGTVMGEWRSSTDVNKTADEFGIWLENANGKHTQFWTTFQK